MVHIHPSAVISPDAQLGDSVEIGPFSIIESGVVVGDGCKVEGHVTIKSGTILGPGNHIFEGAVIGGVPQHLHAPPESGRVVIGASNTIRENVTIHRAVQPDHQTVIGDHNLLMINVHIAHDCRLGNRTIFANNVMLAGHVEVEDQAYVSGAVGVHQFCRIGRMAMVGGQAHVVKDIPPFVTIDGASGFVVGLNLIGLRRNGFSNAEIGQLKAAYRLIYRSGLSWREVVERLPQEFEEGPATRFHEFFSQGTRGFTPERRMPPSPTIKLRSDLQREERTKKAG